MPFKLEAWPGGRWFRDLGDNNGHCWATVQAIKRPTLLEFSGPLFMSQPVANNVQYRLSEENGETAHQISSRRFRTRSRKTTGRAWQAAGATFTSRSASAPKVQKTRIRLTTARSAEQFDSDFPQSFPKEKIPMPVAEAVCTHSIARVFAR